MNSIIGNLKIRDHVTWWLSELAGMLPSVSVPSMNSNNHELSLELHKKEYSLSWPNKDVTEKTNHNFSSNDAIASYKAITSKDEKLVVNSCDFRISNKLILKKEITLPSATEENIENVISYEIDRYTPFKKEDVYFNVKIVSRDKKEKKITVVLSVIKRRLLDDVLDFAKSCDLYVGDLYEFNDGSEEKINFVGFLDNVDQSGKSSSPNKWLWIVTIVLAICALIMPIAKNYWIGQQLNEDLAMMQGEMTEARELLAQYKSVKNNVSLVEKLNLNKTKVIMLLNDLSGIIPNDTSLSRLSLEEGVVRMQGVSDSASKLIPLLDASNEYEEVRFVAPVTQDGNSEKEKFTIEIKLSGSSHAE